MNFPLNICMLSYIKYVNVYIMHSPIHVYVCMLEAGVGQIVRFKKKIVLDIQLKIYHSFNYNKIIFFY